MLLYIIFVWFTGTTSSSDLIATRCRERQTQVYGRAEYRTRPYTMYEVYLEFSAGIDRQNGIAIAEISNQIADSAISLCWLYLVTLFGAL
jgi:hypothetical protein